jgi:hypothetical protein
MQPALTVPGDPHGPWEPKPKVAAARAHPASLAFASLGRLHHFDHLFPCHKVPQAPQLTYARASKGAAPAQPHRCEHQYGRASMRASAHACSRLDRALAVDRPTQLLFSSRRRVVWRALRWWQVCHRPLSGDGFAAPAALQHPKVGTYGSALARHKQHSMGTSSSEVLLCHGDVVCQCQAMPCYCLPCTATADSRRFLLSDGC